MKPETIEQIRAESPGPIPFLYFEDRESPWLLSRLMGRPARIGEVRRAPYGKLLDRPAVRPVVARCGRGVLDPRPLAAVADPEAALAPSAGPVRDPAAEAGLAAALGGTLTGYSLTLAGWDESRVPWGWRYAQMSRRGANLVLRLNFPASHNDAFAASLGAAAREAFECAYHPVGRGPEITMAWARIDLDFGDGEALIEELQSDWFQLVRFWGRHQRKRTRGAHRLTPAGIYLQQVMPAYQKVWNRVLLLAVLWFLTGRIGLSRIYLHRPAGGARLKRIHGPRPPASLYTDLPGRFCFEPTNEAPRFLMRDRGKAVHNLRRSGRPVFWRIEL